MFAHTVRVMGLSLMSLMLLLLPVMAGAQSDEVNASPAPIGQTVIREGDFAVKLAAALSVGTSRDEIEAENQLSEVGISPKNGWIADYPITPDILDELYQAVRDAAASGRIPLSVDVALQRLSEVIREAGLSIETPSAGKTASVETPGYQSSPSSTVINNYYQNEGPPTVTYYAPPPYYYNMYAWVPFPFWSAGIWFPGFFILNDFHRTVIIDNRVVFVSNHFNDPRRHRIVRIDPVERFNGSSIANTGVTHGRRDVPAIEQRREPRRERAIVNEPRTQTFPRIQTAPRMQRVPNSPAVHQPSRRGAFDTNLRSNSTAGPRVNNGASFGGGPSRGNRAMGIHTRSDAGSGTGEGGHSMISSPAGSAGVVSYPRMMRSISPPANNSGVSGMPNRGNREISLPSRGDGFSDRMPSRGSGVFERRGRR